MRLKRSEKKSGMSNPFLKPDHPNLNKRSVAVSVAKIATFEIQNIIQKMIKLANRQQGNKNKPIMVGLAAPQIGIQKRIILVDQKAEGTGKIGNIKIYVNPKIIWSSRKKENWYEGCYSIPGVCGVVSRSVAIKICGYTDSGKFITEKHRGYTARIFQHEIDHLEGVRFPDLITDPKKLHRVKKSAFVSYRNEQAWRNWPDKYPLRKWQQIKND